MHVAPLKHAAPAQSSMLTEQSGPVHPLTQIHEKLPMLFVQVAPFWQTEGRNEHSSTSWVQNLPVYVGGHWHVYELMPSTHVPPFWHWCPGQSSMFSSQLVPRKPENRHNRYGKRTQTDDPQVRKKWSGSSGYSITVYEACYPRVVPAQCNITTQTFLRYWWLCRYSWFKWGIQRSRYTQNRDSTWRKKVSPTY
jgi:hypothetical protein